MTQEESGELTDSVSALQAKTKRATSVTKQTICDDGNSNEDDDKQKHLEKYIEIVEELSSNATTHLESKNGSVVQYNNVYSTAERSRAADEAAQMRRVARWNGGHTGEDKHLILLSAIRDSFR